MMVTMKITIFCDMTACIRQISKFGQKLLCISLPVLSRWKVWAAGHPRSWYFIVIQFFSVISHD